VTLPLPVVSVAIAATLVVASWTVVRLRRRPDAA
jgi:hypothetical protein